MKRIVLIQVLLCISLFAMAQKECKVLSQEVGSIKFEVDEDLPKVETEQKSFMTIKSDGLARSLVSESVPFGYKPEILAYSFADEKMAYAREDVFFHALVRAYAEHRPFVLSPDMVWQLIGFNFSEYVNNHAEAMRSLLVPHEGVKDLKIMTEEDILGKKNANWSDLFDKFSAEIAKNTKGDIAQLMTSDFSTTGQTERIASQITLMESLKSYFHYIAGRLACGIPYIILKGTPADWRKVAEKVQGLEAYNMGWWTKELKPIIAEFVKTAEGHPDSKFWKNIVMEDRPDRLRGGGCSMETPTNLDGWIVKLFPDMKKGVMRKTIPQTQMQGAELSEVKFKYQVLEPFTMKVLEETDIALYAGFVGVTVDEATGAIEPKIGWIARKVDEDAETLARFKNPSFSRDGSGIKIKTVPEVLKKEKHYNQLYFVFEDKVVVPEWMDSIQIDNFTIEGFMKDEEKAKLQKRFPKAKVKRLYHNTTTKKDVAEGEYAYRLDSIVRKTKYDVFTVSYQYDEQGRIVQRTQKSVEPDGENKAIRRKSLYRYDERGYMTEEDVYDGKEMLITEYRVTYNADGKPLVKEETHYNANEKQTMDRYTYTYDQRGNLVEEKREDIPLKQMREFNGKSKTTYAYNSRNQMTEEVIYGYKNNEKEFFPNITTKMEYDKKGRVIHQTTIQTTGIAGDYTSECFIEYTEQNGQVVREQRKHNNSQDEDWKVNVENRAYDTYGNLVREDHEDGNQYKGSTNYYYDLATKAENVMGPAQANKPGMELLKNTESYKYRIMRINTTNAEGDFEALSDDTRFYYSEVKK